MSTRAAHSAYSTMPSTEHCARSLMTAACRAAERGDQLEASNLYRNAGNFFKIARQWEAAGVAYRDAGQLKAPLEADDSTGPSRTTGAPLSTASGLLTTASDCFVKADQHREAETCLLLAAELLTFAGDFFTAAGHYAVLGQLVVPRDMDAGTGHFEEAARLYEIGESAGHYHSDRAWLTVAELLARQGYYKRAIEIYEDVGQRNTPANAPDTYFTFPTTGVGARLYANADMAYYAYFRAVVCHLVRDGPLDAKIAVARYEDRMPAFRSSQQRGILRQAMGHAEDQFTAKNVEQLLTADAASSGIVAQCAAGSPPSNYRAYRLLSEWSRMMMGRALQRLWATEYDRARE
ncbi:alpha-soluble NSF attachment protein-like [Paramacrobiotus metropolitanus]|uniref:alpha-soluble NSF attachment protein-like n=1 Tax=Paramacrobiotus metropolitanus TaxID=2943436 RepID=UPI002445DDCA|nr:alpha-soluble NSF attachment protein-like [Paramacrobiotus metropolitanus]